MIANGTVEVEGNRQVVQHPQGGVVTEILARDASAFFAASMKDMPANVTLSYTPRHRRRACRGSRGATP